MDKYIDVGISDSKLSYDGTKLRTVGLGSCVGVALYSYFTDITALCHIMLPDSQGREVEKCGKYADTSIANVIEQFVEAGVRKEFLKAKIAGGASVVDFKIQNQESIGTQNVNAIRKILKKAGITIIAEDIGGDVSRTLIFDPVTKNLTIKIPGGKSFEI